MQSVIVGEVPLRGGNRAMWPNSRGDGFAGKRGIRQRRAVIEHLKAKFVIRELIRQQHGVVVAEGVESTHRVRIVGETFVTGNMTLHRPSFAAVERFVKALQVVVALGTNEPFGLPDQMIGVGGIDSKVRLAVVVYKERLVHDVLSRVRSEIFASI